MSGESVAAALTRNGIPYGPETPEKLEIYLRLLAEWNEKMDLTAPAEREEWIDRHIVDSLTVLRTNLLDEGRSLIDVGTGAGFPGMALAIARPDLRVTLLDAQQKRLRFLEEVAGETGTPVRLVHARAEDGARQAELREGFDFAAARAVAPLNVLCEYLLPYVRVGGLALCWKGPGLAEEREAGRKAAYLLGGTAEETVSCPIAGREWNHLILPVRKVKPTPFAYPRKAGTPKARPLGGAGS